MLSNAVSYSQPHLTATSCTKWWLDMQLEIPGVGKQQSFGFEPCAETTERNTCNLGSASPHNAATLRRCRCAAGHGRWRGHHPAGRAPLWVSSPAGAWVCRHDARAVDAATASCMQAHGVDLGCGSALSMQRACTGVEGRGKCMGCMPSRVLVDAAVREYHTTQSAITLGTLQPGSKSASATGPDSYVQCVCTSASSCHVPFSTSCMIHERAGCYAHSAQRLPQATRWQRLPRRPALATSRTRTAFSQTSMAGTTPSSRCARSRRGQRQLG